MYSPILYAKFVKELERGPFLKRIAIISLLIVCALGGLPHITSGKDAQQDYKKAEQQFGQGQYFDAIRLYQWVLSAPTNTISPGILYTRIADSYFRLMDYSRARDAYRKALFNQKPDKRAETLYWIGFCELLLGSYEQAIAAFLKIPEQHPESGMWVGTAYYWAGRASERMGNKEQAVEYYRMAGGKGKSTQERFAIKKAGEVK